MIDLNFNYKIYGRTRGRKKIKIIDIVFLKNYKINFKNNIINNKKNILDIGSGSGENSIFLAKKNSDALIIACEIYQDGNIDLCRKISKSKITNIKLFNFNVIKLFDKLKVDNCFDEVWVLFPDPWPKKRHHKRRLINNNFLNKIYPFLKSDGKIFIATDSISYLNSIMNTIYDLKSLFKWKNSKPLNWIYEILDLPRTKFFKKAQNLHKSSFFIELQKI